jgi:tetratricopeptide (TPR) repeat protein
MKPYIASSQVEGAMYSMKQVDGVESLRFVVSARTLPMGESRIMFFCLVSAKVNLRMVILVFMITLLLGAAVFIGHRYRVQVLTQNALARGQVAYDRADWSESAKYLKLYLEKNPEDIDILRYYASAQEKISPPTSQTLYTAIDAYRRIVRLRPQDRESYQRLADLYERTGNFGELIFVAQRHLQHSPQDFTAKFQLAKAYIRLHKTDPARKLLVELVDVVEQNTSCKRKEFSEICWLLGGIDSQHDHFEIRNQAVRWLDRAVTYQPDNALPYLYRARFYRLSPSIHSKDRKIAVKDLELAESKENEDPRVSLELCHEWIKHDRFDLAAHQLQNVDRFSTEAIRASFINEENFIAIRYILVSELIRHSEAYEQGAAQTDDILARLTDKSQRVRVLPFAIRIYALAGQPDSARRCLNEYLDLVRGMDNSAKLSGNLVFLKSLVDGSQGRFYQVIDNIEPWVERDSSNVSLWAMLCDAYLQTGQTRRAIAAMTKYCAIRRDDHKMVLRLARVYYDTRQWQKAYTLATELRTRNAENKEAVLLSIQAGIELLGRSTFHDLSSPNPETMRRDLERLQSASPQDIRIRLARAEFALKQDGFEPARLILLQAAEQCSDSLSVKIRLVRLYISSNKLNEAEILSRQLCGKYPDRIEAWLTLVDLYQLNHRYQAARETLVLAMDKVSDDDFRKILTKRLAILEILHENRQAGLTLLMQIAESDENDLQVRATILSMPEIYKNTDKAQKLVNDIRDIEGPSGLLWRLQQSSLWINTGRWNENRVRITEYLNRCIQADPEWSDPVILLGRMYERMGDIASAESLYRRTLSAKPSMVDVVDELIALLEKQHRYVEAMEMINSLHLVSRQTNSRRIRILVHSRNIQQAIEELRLQISNCPDDIHSRLLLARLTWQELNDVDLAMKYLDEIDAVLPDAMASLAFRVAILNAADQTQEAIDLLDRAARERDTFEVWLVRATFLANIGHFDEAQECFTHLTRLDKNGQSYEILGKFHVDHQRLDEAIDAWRQGAAVCPSNTQIKRRLIKALLLRGSTQDKADAISMLNELEKEYTNDADLLWVRALILLDEHKTQVPQARKLIQRVVQIDPQAVDAHLKLIAMARDSLDYISARDLAIRGLAANPESISLLLARAEAEKLLGNHQATLEMARLVLDKDPGNINAMKLIIECGIHAGNDELIRDMQMQVRLAANHEPDNEQLCLLDAQVTLALGMENEAITLLETFNSKNDSSPGPGVSLMLAELYRKKKNYDRAGHYLHQAAQQAPFAPWVVGERIRWLGDQHRYDQIMKEIADYQEYAEGDPEIIALAGEVLGVSENPDHRNQSWIWLMEAVSAKPHLIDAQLQLGWRAMEAQKYDLAEKAYRTTLKYQQSNIHAINNLAWILANHKHDFDAALALADRGLGLSPNNPDILDTRASIFALMPAKLLQARQDYLRCLELLPDDSSDAAHVMLKLVDLCIRLKDYPQARLFLDQACDIDLKKNVFNASQRMNMEKYNTTLTSVMRSK